MCIRGECGWRAPRRHEVDQGIAVLWNKGIQVDEGCNSVGQCIGDAGDHHAAVGVADQNNVRQPFFLDDIHDIGDVGVEIDARTHQMDALAQPSQCRRIGFVAGLAQLLGDRTPVPAADPSAMNQHEVRHFDLPESVVERPPRIPIVVL